MTFDPITDGTMRAALPKAKLVVTYDHFTPSHQILEKSAKKLNNLQQNKQI